MKGSNNPHNLRLPQNYILEDEDYFYPHFEYRLLEPSILPLNNVLYFQNGIVTNLSGRKLKEHLPWKEWGEQYKNTFFLKRVIKALFRNDVQYLLHNKTSYVIAVNPFGDNYFHWMTEVLPKLLYLKERLGDEITLILPADCNKEYQIESLRLLNISTKYFKSKAAFISRAYISTPFSEYPGYFHKTSIQKIKSLFRNIDNLDRTTPKRIYLSRNFQVRRKVGNEEELKPILERYGFEIIYPEKLSFFESIALYNSTSILVSAHGAALTNMIFLPKNASVIELHLEKIVTDKCYFIMANVLDLNYYYQNCISAENNQDHINANIIVDKKSFEINLQTILKKMNLE